MFHQSPKQSQTGSVLVVLLALVAVLAIGAAGYFYWQHQQDQAAQQQLAAQLSHLNDTLNGSPAPTPSEEPLKLPPGVAPTPEPETQKFGTIQGKLSYPAEMLPKQRICAINIMTAIETCTEEYDGNTYKLSIAPATYHVYAMVAPGSDAPLKTKAFYTKFVTCGLNANCPSHDMIDVVVKPGEVISNVDPGDWYNQ